MSKLRNPRDFRATYFQPYATAIGELTLVWNDLHEGLATLFWAAIGIPNGLIPRAVWYALKSDPAFPRWPHQFVTNTADSDMRINALQVIGVTGHGAGDG